MPAKRSSDRQAKDLADALLDSLRRLANDSGEIAMSDEQFWDICRDHYAALANLAAVVNEEVAEERKAKSVGGGQVRSCIACSGPVVKRHVRGRWPIYCEDCGLKDRKSPSSS